VVESAPGLGAAFTAWFPMASERRTDVASPRPADLDPLAL
jgi:hypothetical protein